MKKINLYILLVVTVILVLGVIIYKNNHTVIIKSNPNPDGWTTITDCTNIKLYFWDGKNPSQSGLEDEQDIVIDYEKKILSIGLNEKLYGPRKRLEVSYAKPSDYENCSPDVKKLISVTVGPNQ